MPTVLFINGLRFFFYSNENDEPIHIHVKKGSAVGKIWLVPKCEIAYLHGFTNAEEKNILEIVNDNFELLKTKWNEHFNK
jgi:hypothetical protein